MGTSAARRVGVLGYDGVTALDLIGPIEAFANVAVAPELSGIAAYEIVVIGVTGRRFTAESGVEFRAHTTLLRAPKLDTLILPGGSGLRAPRVERIVSAWITERARDVRRIASVCTGIYGLAATGLLDGRRTTTHWRFAADVARRFPRLRVDPNALYVKDGKFYTSAGITAGIDLALALIEEDHGPSAALRVARELVLHRKRAGGQEQYSEPLRFQTQVPDRLADAIAWISDHLRADLSVEALASRANLCPRHFSRVFKEATGLAPGEFVANARLDEARRRFSAGTAGVDVVAGSVGYAVPDTFRRAFARRFGVSPGEYRSRFRAV